MVAEIINRGRGPEIAGTPITVYDVLDYRKHGWHAGTLSLLLWQDQSVEPATGHKANFDRAGHETDHNRVGVFDNRRQRVLLKQVNGFAKLDRPDPIF